MGSITARYRQTQEQSMGATNRVDISQPQLHRGEDDSSNLQKDETSAQ